MTIINSTDLFVNSITYKSNILEIHSKLVAENIQAQWITSWNIGIMALVIGILVIWNIWITYKLKELKEKQ